MSMSIGPALRMKAKPEMHPEVTYRLTLELYLEQEDVARRLWDGAASSGNIRTYQKHGLDFDYAVVNTRDVPADIVRQCGHAFAHCLYDPFEALLFGKKYAMKRGQWMKFVVRGVHEPLPPEYTEYAAVHEYGEEVTAGEHDKASVLEWSVAKMERNLRRYLRWIEQNAPTKLMDLYAYSLYRDMMPEEMLEIAETYAAGDERIQRVRELIESLGMPREAERIVERYAAKGEEIDELMSEFHGKASGIDFHLTGLGNVERRFLMKYIMQHAVAEIVRRRLDRYMYYPVVEARRNDVLRFLEEPHHDEIASRLHVLSEKLLQPISEEEKSSINRQIRDLEQSIFTGLPEIADGLEMERHLAQGRRYRKSVVPFYFSVAADIISGKSGLLVEDDKVHLFVPDYLVHRTVHELNARGVDPDDVSESFNHELQKLDKAYQRIHGEHLIGRNLVAPDFESLAELHRKINE